MNTGKLVLSLILLILGGAAGYFYGFDVGFENGVASVEESEAIVEGETLVVEEIEKTEESTTTEEVIELEELE